MANSRIMLTCRHCGEQVVLGAGSGGKYHTSNYMLDESLNEFFGKHGAGRCSDNINCADDAKEHFVILEEGDGV